MKLCSMLCGNLDGRGVWGRMDKAQEQRPRFAVELLHSKACAVLCLVSQSSPTLRPHGLCSPPGSSVHGDSPGKNIGVGCYALLQGIFPTQGANGGLPCCRWILYPTELPGKPHSKACLLAKEQWRLVPVVPVPIVLALAPGKPGTCSNIEMGK